jgi:hypothetical protein
MSLSDSDRRGMDPAEDCPVYSVEFPIKLNDSYPCQGIEQPGGAAVAFDDLLSEGDVVAKYADDEGNTWGPSGIVVRREDGLWIVPEDGD